MGTAEVVAGKAALRGHRKFHHTEGSSPYVFVMTKSDRGVTPQGERASKGMRCRWCRHVLPVSTGPGRKREFCSQRCRQWDWVARQRAAELELSENELVVTRVELDELKDMIYVLHCAVVDAQRDLANPRQTKESLTELIGWLLEAAEPVAQASLSPSPLVGNRP